ncbi:MAG: carboxypeptidase regulatory-like domain-containing protein [Myxococcaceae bacterium]
MRGQLTRVGVAFLAVLGSALAGSGVARAEAPPAYNEVAAARLRYGAAMRLGSQQDPGPGLSYSGITPDDVALEGWYFPSRHLGLTAYGQREGFGLYGPGGRVTAGSLWRGHLGPAVRLGLGRLSFEAVAAYQFAQVPGFGSSVAPAFGNGQRHSALLAARAMVDLGPIAVELNGELPVALSTSAPGGVAGKSTGLGVGATVRIPLVTSGTVEYAALLDGQYVRDSLSWAPDPALPAELTRSDQELTRFGAAVQVRWLDAPPPPPAPRFGGLQVAVVDESTGAAIAGASVELEVNAARQPLGAAADGRFSAFELEPGPVVARAGAGGYLPGEGRAEVVAGSQGRLELKLKKEPPKVGALAITVVDKESGAPIAQATLLARDGKYFSSEAGAVALVELPPGPMQLSVTAKGYQPVKEVAQVAAGQRSPVVLAMLKEARRELATITGRVRSTAGGKPVAASLELPQAKAHTRADAGGAFTFRVEGGVYTVEISAPGYRSQTKSVTVKDGDQAIFNVDLHPK